MQSLLSSCIYFTTNSITRVVTNTKQDKRTICPHLNSGGGASSLQSIPDENRDPAREDQHQEDAEAP